jgi:hypothetical protein
MAASLLPSSASGNPQSPIHIVSSHIQKQGMTYLYLRSATNTYSNRIEIMKWVTEKRQPFAIVKDPQFVFLMKTGHPGYRLLSAPTVARDVKHIFIEMCQQISKMLKITQRTYLLIHLTNFTHRELTVC